MNLFLVKNLRFFSDHHHQQKKPKNKNYVKEMKKKSKIHIISFLW